MIAVLPNPMTATDKPSGNPRLIMALCYDEDGGIIAVTNDEDGNLSTQPLVDLQTNMRYDYPKEDWFDADLRAQEEREKAGLDDPE